MCRACVPTFNSFIVSAEMIGFKNLDPYYSDLPMLPSIQFFINNSNLDSISNIQRGQYINSGAVFWGASYTFYDPVPLEIYVQFSFLNYFMAFIGILFLQTFTIFLMDIFWLKSMPSSVTLWERILHAIQKSHFPFPYENWYDGGGSCLDHVKRKNLVHKEILTATIANLVFNMVMLIPLVILCKIKKNDQLLVFL